MRERNPELLLLDTGDLFGVDDGFSKAQTVLEAYRLAKYDLVALGDQDLLRGELTPAYLLDRLPLACANVSPTDKESPPLPPVKVFERHGVKIGVTALIHPDCFLNGPDLAALGYGVSDWREPLTEAVEYLKETGCEVVIVLSHLGVPGEVEISRDFPQVDLIVGGHSGLFRWEPEASEGAPIVWPGRKGRYVGVARLSLADEDRGTLLGYEAIAVDGAEVGTDPDTRQVILAYEEERYSDWLERFYEPVGDYTWKNPEECGACHAPQYEQWSSTPHARAWETLERTGDDVNLECIRCHSTGFGKPGGYGSVELTPHLTGVGCQMCHQTPEGHPAGGYPPEPEAKLCASCHKAGFDDDFSFSRDAELVSH